MNTPEAEANEYLSKRRPCPIELLRKVLEKIRQEDNESAEKQAELMAVKKREDDAYQKAMDDFCQKREEERVGHLLDAVAKIRKELDDSQQAMAFLSAEGKDVTDVQKNIDELKRKRAFTIHCLNGVVNPSTSIRRMFGNCCLAAWSWNRD